MKDIKKYLFFTILLTTSFFYFMSTQKFNENSVLKPLQQVSDTTEWIAPDSVNDLVNPIENDEESLKEGKMSYRVHCRSCHGKLGDGKGSGAGDISTVVTDFTNPEFHNQSDGSMFWKIAEGRNDMEPYKKKISEDEIWEIVIYIKTFAPAEQ